MPSSKSEVANKNFFMKSKENNESEKEEFVFQEQSFPSLGKSEKNNTPIKSFSAALNKEHKEKEKNKWAGWIIINSDGIVNKYEDSERYKDVKKSLDEMKIHLCNVHFEKRLYEEERKKEIEYYLNGPEYIKSWEVEG